MTATAAALDAVTTIRPDGADASSDPLGERALARRAVEAAIWGMPIVSVDAMREAFFRDAAARYNDIVFWSKPSDWRNQLTTPNASTYYVYFNFNTRNGPVVLEVPAANGAGLFGTLLDAWQVPLVDVGPKGEDEGLGGRYLLLPPDYGGPVPEGLIPVRCPTYNGYALLRAIPASASEADVTSAVALVKHLRLYALARAASPPPQRFVDMADRLLDGIVRYDATFYARLARMVNEEPIQPRDLVMMGQLRSLGIEKGREFAPDNVTAGVLAGAIEEAHASFRGRLAEELRPWWPGTHWGLPETAPFATATRFSFQTDGYLDVDARAPIYFLTCAPPARPGEASFYLLTFHDEDGGLLRGGTGYTLHIPAGVPAEQFWAVTVYDATTAGFLRESPCVGLDSYSERMVRNDDGSVDVYFGATAPAGRRGNWVYTAPGKAWFVAFRFYGPGAALFEKRWTLPDLVRRGG
jgi:hypothetical protein